VYFGDNCKLFSNALGGVKMKKYRIGMYGGKFMPFHRGHALCLDRAAAECEIVYVILMYNGNQELEILSNDSSDYLKPDVRFDSLKKYCSKYSNVVPCFMNVIDCVDEQGREDWNKETPLVRKITGPCIDAVYSSEPKYDEYFSKAYPEAVHVLVDPLRKVIPISGTKCRLMNEKERLKWTV
jgi:HTH-type transcriptional repressor of NAD biosynthesis genes